MYICPLCEKPLEKDKADYYCENNHHYDIAKEEYVNLLLPNQKRSKNPGDDRDMLIARRDFLNTDCYNKLVEEVIMTIKETACHSKILDIGCGEGFYTNNIFKQFDLENLFGLDISKHAIQMASKKYRSINFCVASSVHLPYASESFDLALSVFAPYNVVEVVRVLKSQGIFIVVGPNSDHLKELAGVIYDSVEPHQMEVIDNPELKLIKQKVLKYDIQISEENIVNLWKMSPYFWHTREGLEDEVKKINKITFDFRLDSYQVSETTKAAGFARQEGS